MPFRGYFALNDVEFANSSRVVVALKPDLPTTDTAVFGGGSGHAPTEVVAHPGLFTIPADSAAVSGHPHLYTPPNGTRRYDRGLYEIDDEGWGVGTPCASCRSTVLYDDSWPGLKGFLGDTVYRLELAPWYSTQIPESAEFTGVWVLDVKGLGAVPIQRQITELVGDGGIAALHRDTSRAITFDALLLACTNAGLEFGAEWLACQLRATKGRTDSVLRYLTAHPSHSGADPDTLVREMRGVVYSTALAITEAQNVSGSQNQQATQYRVSFGLTALSPYAWLPEVPVTVDWDSIDLQPIQWVHATDCTVARDCDDMPVLFSDTCRPEAITIAAGNGQKIDPFGRTSPPPVCGGCLPLCEIDTYTFTVPTMSYPILCRETAANVTITNTGATSLTLQAYWAKCAADTGCANEFFPVQISGLPSDAALTLDATTGRFWALYGGFKSRAVGIVSTPTGAPWMPPIIDRHQCWKFVVVAPVDAEFDVAMSLVDRGS